MEALGPECECWRFMSGAGRRGVQLTARDSWAARGREGSRGLGVGSGWLQGRGEAGKRETSSRLPPTPAVHWEMAPEGGQRSQADLKVLGSSRLSGHSKGGDVLLLSCPPPAVLYLALNPRHLGHSSSCARPSAGSGLAGEGSSCHPSPQTGGRSTRR